MFQRRTDPEVTAQMLLHIRQSLATIDLEIVTPDSLSAFARHASADIEELQYVIAMHHRSQHDKNTIFILPFLPRIETLIECSVLSPDTASLPGHDLDVAIVSIAKAMVHETRHAVGMLVCAPLYSLATCDLLNMISRSMGQHTTHLSWFKPALSPPYPNPENIQIMFKGKQRTGTRSLSMVLTRTQLYVCISTL